MPFRKSSPPGAPPGIDRSIKSPPESPSSSPKLLESAPQSPIQRQYSTHQTMDDAKPINNYPRVQQPLKGPQQPQHQQFAAAPIQQAAAYPLQYGQKQRAPSPQHYQGAYQFRPSFIFTSATSEGRNREIYASEIKTARALFIHAMCNGLAKPMTDVLQIKFDGKEVFVAKDYEIYFLELVALMNRKQMDAVVLKAVYE